ncbi:uncharacterized protein LOC123316355 [Coccinella septempunctata]|uniref:uncharacterized protein LOC123316355 n=1 Tax=Coccinella septempunctata TaxID=41139 RepID=UPI001D0980B7|nr:uncharacterized protein LOC123316355 [Coccinella septempunctata]
MNKLNMLSARKVKLHGMTSAKWTTKDKITQYKGLINLYLRDSAILKTDTNVTKRRQTKELKQLQKQIETNRGVLDNAIRGDKQQLRNTLAEHREMQLAYQNHQPKKVIDAIHQINFNKRKELDKLEFRMKQKSDKLIDLKLELAVLEDRIKYANPNEFPVEKQSAIVTGKVQDAILKKEAALAIRQTFIQIIDIMKKDALYFDAILATMKGDAEAQGACMINATKLGQLATEYLDDRRNEYKTLEKAVKRDMMARKQDLTMMQDKISNFATNIKQLLRRDSDLNLGVITIEKTESEIELREDFAKIVETLNSLKSSTLVSNFDMIFPCFQTQLQHFNRLTELAQKCEENRDILLKKANHAEVMRDVMHNSMVDTTYQYRTEKKDLLAQMESLKERRIHALEVLEKKSELLAGIRISLRQLQQMVKILKIEGMPFERSPAPGDEDVIIKPEEDEIDGIKIIHDLKKCIARLMTQMSLRQPIVHEEALKNFETMIIDRSRIIPLDVKVSDESLLEGMALEITNVPTREEIKRISDEIVDINTKTEEYMASHGKL